MGHQQREVGYQAHHCYCLTSIRVICQQKSKMIPKRLCIPVLHVCNTGIHNHRYKDIQNHRYTGIYKSDTHRYITTDTQGYINQTHTDNQTWE